MTRVFLSYAEEDGSAARTLAALLGQHGFDVFWYEETNRGEWVAALSDELRKADRFVVLLSSHYQQSEWCTKEWLTAYRMAVDPKIKRPVITVCEVGDFDEPVEPFLGNYARHDLRALTEAKLAGLLATFGVQAAPPDGGRFRNREQELTNLLDALSLSSGQDLWVVAAPPRMGKSWFLREVERRLTARSWGETRLLDLARWPELWGAPAKVVVELMGVNVEPEGDSLTEDEVEDIAREVSKRGNNQLYLLDSAERLDRATAAKVRSALTAVYTHLVERRMRKRFSVIIGTRRPNGWHGLGRYAQCRFITLSLSEFKLDVIEQAVRDGVPDADDGLVRRSAVALQRESDGLPALLSAWMDWAYKANLIGIERGLRKSSTFDAVTAKYVRTDLLTHDVLFPSGVTNAPAAKEALDHALKALAPYRLITQSHLKFHYDSDEALRDDATSAGWNMRELWAALNSTSLLEPRSSLWRVINPPIRRVLYRYYYRTDGERASAHEGAKWCYQKWTVNQAGSEQVVMMVECLWHELCGQLLQQPSRLHETLPETAGQLAKDFLNSDLYDPREFAECVHELLIDDHEFQLTLHDHTGLFQEVLSAIDTAVSEGT
ncbi:toll/interleukin-1 receptor domain-containing protein [Lentzea kentuckyensis]|uniref:toll/interleukin-1 receptor domain-containing protein n=1 Tax=Lentzea kentuckyensis TaxID=360086 RepID=UPI001302B25E|nr:toll/interleukin-1 receptor domain-containing protein [Lentzea kentuckyensis]